MKYGFFDDASKEYVITRPDTPLPWINYLGCEEFFSLMSGTSGGYCFYKDAKMLRLTRYRYNNIPTDEGGRYFYINEKQDVWSVGWQPVRAQLDNYRCRHGLGYTVIESARGGLQAEQTSFVPLGATCEVHRLRLRNDTNAPKEFTLFSFVEFCLWNALDDMTNFQRNLSLGEVEVEGSAIYHKSEYRERRNHYAVFSVNTPIDGYNTCRDAFLGAYNPLSSPAAVTESLPRNSVASGWAPVGSHCVKVQLDPGEEKSYIFVLGYVENKDSEKWERHGVINKAPAKALLAKFQTDAQVDEALAALAAHWDSLLGRLQMDGPEPEFARMVNIWNQYQCMQTFNLSRSASYYESGIGRGMGFRDSCQDIVGFAHMLPHRARQRILDIAATQFEDGSTYHQYQPLTKQGNLDVGSGFNDDPLWLIFAVSAYIKETGDMTILDEKAAFADGDTVTIMEHLKASFNHVVNNRGPHGLPLIGRADWNDCLNLNCFSEHPGESFQTCSNREGGSAQSVFIAGMFVGIGKDYAQLCRRRGQLAEAQRAEDEIAAMRQAVLDHGWDGDWFVRAYDWAGQPVGSKSCDEGQIFIEPQGICVMAGIGIEEGLAERALDSVAQRLDTDYGIMLLQPAYTSYRLNLGEISSYPPGYKENAGIFCHNNPWITIAETCLGRGNRAFEVYKKTCPAYLEDIAELHRTEPYVYSQMIAGRDAPHHGEAKNSWLTGTAAWSLHSAVQYILGVRTHFDGLELDPCLPAHWRSLRITRQFRGDVYEIEIENPHGVQKGVHTLLVDGQAPEDGIIRPFGDGKVHQVKVVMG